MKRFNKVIAMFLVFAILFTSQAATDYAFAVSGETTSQLEGAVEVQNSSAEEETTDETVEEETVVGEEKKSGLAEEETVQNTENTAEEAEGESAVEDEELAVEIEEETAVGGEELTEESEVETESRQEVLDLSIQYVYLESSELVAPGTQNILISADTDIASMEEVYLTIQKDGQTVSTIPANKAIENLLLFTREYSTSESGTYKVLNFTYKLNGESYTCEIEEDIAFVVGNEKTPEIGVFSTPEITEAEIENSVISTETEITSKDVESAITNSEGIIKETEVNGKGLDISSTTTIDGVSISKNARMLRTSTSGSKIVIVLDPGHGGSDSGAVYGSLLEKNLNLAIARYAKAELEKYGVTVYLTRDSDTYVGLYDRANYAKSVGATALVSIHINSTTGGATSANGAEVFVTAYSKYNASSTQLANLILRELAKVGLSTSRGVKINNDDHNNGQYDDGTWKDDLAVIRQSILNGIPAILVEHGFINNSGDYSLLASEAKLKEMGIADATAIAEHYGLRVNHPLPTASSLKVSNISELNGTFDVTLSGIVSSAGINTVKIPVWSAANQSDLHWYIATRQSDGSYKVNIDVANHNYNYGTYYIHAYVVDGAGRTTFVKGISQNMIYPVSSSPVVITATGNSAQTQYTLNAKNVLRGAGIKNVRFAVWSKTDGQDDLVWYTGTNNSSGNWAATAKISNHQTEGTYYVHTYADYVNGTSRVLGTTTFEVLGPYSKSIVIDNRQKSAGTFDVSITGVQSISGVQNVRLAVWNESMPGTTYWYTGVNQGNGTYRAHINIANHKYNYGNYTIHVYATDGNGITKYINGIKEKFVQPVTTISAVPNANQTSYTLNANGVGYGTGVKNVRFAVWSKTEGQDDLVWYPGSNSGSGNWSATAKISNHKSAGTYYVHTYANFADGTSKVVGTTTFEVAGPSSKSMVIDNRQKNAGTFDISITGIQSTSGIQNVRLAVWNDDVLGTSYWYTGVDQGNGTYRAHINIANHKYTYGNYTIHVYATDGNGITKYINGTREKFDKPTTAVTALPNGTQASYTLNANSVAYGSGVKNVRFAVWSQSGGQDDLVWYTGTKNSSGNWTSTANISNHKTEGVYSVHAYAGLANGISQVLGTTSFTVTGPSVNKVSVSRKDEANGYFEVQASGVSSGSGIQKVRMAVWCAANQSDLVWYEATKTGDGSYTAYVDIKNHKNNLGNYQVHVYVLDNNGIYKYGGAAGCTILNVSSASYLIMGSSVVTAKQLVNYYNANATYPSYYGISDAPTIESFCQIYLEESNAEGVKAEVAFAQSMKETNFLRYTGTVGITQYNFAGIGATGPGIVGNSFLSVRLGIRAHIQHLKAYASSDNLNNPCVDPRFQYVPRGTAIYVEWLGINENPYGRGWATAVNYGYSVVNDYVKKLISY